VTGTTPSTKEKKYWDKEEVNWLTPAEMDELESKIYINSSRRRISKEALNNNNLTLMPEGSIVISTRAPVGYVGILKEPSTFNQGCKGLIPIDKDVIPEFYYYYLLKNQKKLQNLSSGSTFKELPKDRLTGFSVPVPSIQEQKSIAEILLVSDEAIQKVNKIIEKTKRIKEGLMQELLTKGIGHKEFKKTKLGYIPKNRDICKIPSLFEIIDGDRGKNYPSISDLNKDGYCLFLNAKNVTNQGLNFQENQFISKEKDVALGKGKLKRNDIILTTRGTTGNIGFYNNNIKFDNMRINSGMVILRSINENNYIEFYYNLFQSTIFQNQIRRTSYGSAQPQLSVKDIKELLIYKLPLNEQKEITSIIRQMTEEIEFQRNKKQKLERIRKGLMEDLLTGKKRIKI